MTIEEAKARAKAKLDKGLALDLWDLENLLNSVYNEGFHDGQQFAYGYVSSFIERNKQ